MRVIFLSPPPKHPALALQERFSLYFPPLPPCAGRALAVLAAGAGTYAAGRFLLTAGLSASGKQHEGAGQAAADDDDAAE